MTPSLPELAGQFTQLLPVTAAVPQTPTEGVATTAPEGVPPPSPASAVRVVDFTVKGFHLEVTVPPTHVVAAAALLDQQGFSLDTVTGVDWLAQGEMEVVYDYFHPAVALRVAVRVRIPRNQPEIPTISVVFPGANWHERETHDFFGIRFLNHPDLTPLLLPEDADYHPLRKDYAP